MRIYRGVIQNGAKYSKTILQLDPDFAVILIDNEHSAVCIKIIVAYASLFAVVVVHGDEDALVRNQLF